MELAHVVRIKRFVRKGEWTVIENVSKNEMTGATGSAKAHEKSSEHVGAATQVETRRPDERALETSADQVQQEEAGASCHLEMEGATLRRSTRTRGAPDRVGLSGEASAVGAVLLLLGLLGLFMGVQPSQGMQRGSFVKDGVVFKFQGEIFFSDSEWVVLTDVSLGSIETTITALRHWFSVMANEGKGVTEVKSEHLRTRVKDRAMEGLELLKVVNGRSRTLREALVGPKKRSKRGLVDAGGTVLQWLFGVATGRDLEGLNGQLQALGRETTGIIHAVAQQATLVNETCRELGEHVLVMQQLNKAHMSLEKEFNWWKVNIVETVSSLERQMLLVARIDDALRTAQQTMDWVRMTLEDVRVSLALLATGKLPPELFPPSQLRIVLKDIRSRLTTGWDLTPALQTGDLWRAYQEAQVVSAATKNGLRLFIHLPIIEVTQSFELYEIFVLPVFSTAGNIGLRYAPIPAFLAVGMDRQTFMELTESGFVKVVRALFFYLVKPSTARTLRRPAQWRFSYKILKRKKN